MIRQLSPIRLAFDVTCREIRRIIADARSLPRETCFDLQVSPFARFHEERRCVHPRIPVCAQRNASWNSKGTRLTTFARRENERRMWVAILRGASRSKWASFLNWTDVPSLICSNLVVRSRGVCTGNNRFLGGRRWRSDSFNFSFPRNDQSPLPAAQSAKPFGTSKKGRQHGENFLSSDMTWYYPGGGGELVSKMSTVTRHRDRDIPTFACGRRGAFTRFRGNGSSLKRYKGLGQSPGKNARSLLLRWSWSAKNHGSSFQSPLVINDPEFADLRKFMSQEMADVRCGSLANAN